MRNVAVPTGKIFKNRFGAFQACYVGEMFTSFPIGFIRDAHRDLIQITQDVQIGEDQVGRALDLEEQKNTPFTWGDVKHIEFEDDDVIRFEYVEGYYSENNSYDEHFSGMVIRKVLETDEQFERRQKRITQDEKWAKERRYESYLRLKKEFEGYGKNE